MSSFNPTQPESWAALAAAWRAATGRAPSQLELMGFLATGRMDGGGMGGMGMMMGGGMGMGMGMGMGGMGGMGMGGMGGMGMGMPAGMNGTGNSSNSMNGNGMTGQDEYRGNGY
jgi:hypothetical protein